MHKRFQKGQNPWLFIIGLIVILSMLFTIFSQKKQETLPVYTRSDKIQREDSKEDQEIKFDTVIYTDEEHHLSMEVPSD